MRSKHTFLHALANLTRDRKILRDQIFAILMAGRDTTASALSWVFYELARHPEITRKLRAEIIDTVGLDAAPTYHDLKGMKYLQVSRSRAEIENKVDRNSLTKTPPPKKNRTPSTKPSVSTPPSH